MNKNANQAQKKALLNYIFFLTGRIIEDVINPKKKKKTQEHYFYIEIEWALGKLIFTTKGEIEN